MISERIFAKDYSSFWTENTPWFRDYYSSAMALGTRTGKSIDIPENPDHVYINNIIATTHFRNIMSDQAFPLEKSFEDSIPVIDIFSRKKRENYTLTDDYRKIIIIQAGRLSGLYSGVLVHDPEFPGCGIMANCNGDLIFGTTLVEIKAHREQKGRKPFRPEDFRQLLVYCALNYIAGEKYKIQRIQLFNPRMGYLWQSDLEEFVSLISNAPADSLFENMGSIFTDISESFDMEGGFDGSYF